MRSIVGGGRFGSSIVRYKYLAEDGPAAIQVYIEFFYVEHDTVLEADVVCRIIPAFLLLSITVRFRSCFGQGSCAGYVRLGIIRTVVLYIFQYTNGYAAEYAF